MAALTQAELEALYVEQNNARSVHTIGVINALIEGKLELTNVDLGSLTLQVNSIRELLDGDPNSDGYQKFAALSLKLNNVVASSATNASAITALQTALNTQIATLSGRVTEVETESRDGRAALDQRINTLAAQYEAHVAAALVKNNEQDNRLDDHKTRIEALESSKVLIEDRLKNLESDNTLNKSAIAQIQTSLTTQATALQQELERAQAAEHQLRTELEAERTRIDGVVTKQETFATRQNVADAHTAGQTAGCINLWAVAGIPMPAGLPMPDGTTSA